MNERRTISLARIVALVALVFWSAFSAVAQSNDVLVGTWRLVSVSSSTEKVRSTKPFMVHTPRASLRTHVGVGCR